MMALSTNFAGTNGLQEGIGNEVVAQLASNIRHVKVGDDKDPKREEALLGKSFMVFSRLYWCY